MTKTPQNLGPQMAAALAKAAELTADQTDSYGLVFPKWRRALAPLGAYWNEGGPTVTKSVGQWIDDTGRQIRILLFSPSPTEPLPIIVYLHDGG